MYANEQSLAIAAALGILRIRGSHEVYVSGKELRQLTSVSLLFTFLSRN